MEYKHFSHPHSMSIHQVRQSDDLRCTCCELPCSSGSVYACWKCLFFLHEKCGNAKRLIEHPSHIPHPLTLVHIPTHHSNSFMCKACHKTGTSFSYCCALCDFDLHVQCASLPKAIEHEAHPHKLILAYSEASSQLLSHRSFISYLYFPLFYYVFSFVTSLLISSPLWQTLVLFCGVYIWVRREGRIPSKQVGICNICHQVLDHKLWSYNCLDCHFRAHACCATMVATGPKSDLAGVTTNPHPGSL